MYDDAYDNCMWYHIILTAYGAWLPGDARGFRTRHHREHVEGDYKNPPPAGLYERRLERSKRLLKEPPVIFPIELRPRLARLLREKMETFDAWVIAQAVGNQHVHILAKLPKDQARFFAGEAKKHAWHSLHADGWKGKLWGKCGREIPIRTRGHQCKTFRYIAEHEEEGAYLWLFNEL